MFLFSSSESCCCCWAGREIPVNNQRLPKTFQELGLGPCVTRGCSPRGEGGWPGGRGVAVPAFGTDEFFWSFQLELAGWTRRAGSPREDRLTARRILGPGERKMKVLLVLTILFACSVFTAHGKHPRTFTPGLEGSTVGNLTAHGCYSGWGTSRASVDRCCLLRACCYARLAERRCRLGPVQPVPAARAGIPTCRSGTWCQRGACRCERAARLCRAQLGRAQLRRRARCRGRAGRC
ncbi:phospholipase A2, membrane associated-like isoform X1 [Prinia subflava]|uniref:phospholipase A2, membrane associated-like isoform X1 n=1 Tax=Prinia subflava TaxID=208062 RepID=UPI002FE2137B